MLDLDLLEIGRHYHLFLHAFRLGRHDFHSFHVLLADLRVVVSSTRWEEVSL